MLSSLDLKRGKSAVHMTSRIAHREIENKTNFFISFMWCPLGLGFFLGVFDKGFVDKYSIRIYTERILADWRGF